MLTNEKKKQYDLEYAKKNLKRIPLDVQKEKYEQIKEAAQRVGTGVNTYIKESIDLRMATSLDLEGGRWFAKTFSKDVETLINYVDAHGYLFKDMLFADGSFTCDYISVDYVGNDGNIHEDNEYYLPECFANFSYDCFDFYVTENLNDYMGTFDPIKQSITINTEYLGVEHVILHEMIHLHEYVLERAGSQYREIYFYCLYKELEPQISDLDKRIEEYAHVSNTDEIMKIGGFHSILFLMKSFDLDLKMGYELGTVMGYDYK